MERYNFHNTHFGWNYFVEFASTGKVRFGRYHTNGHVNTDEMKTKWVDAQTAGVDITDITAYVAEKKADNEISKTIKFNANVECQRGVEMLTR